MRDHLGILLSWSRSAGQQTYKELSAGYPDFCRIDYEVVFAMASEGGSIRGQKNLRNLRIIPSADKFAGARDLGNLMCKNGL
jgi:hypothetical protein